MEHKWEEEMNRHQLLHRKLPKRIILVRHGESQGNLSMSAYTTTPDHRIPLTLLGLEQARAAGQQIKEAVSKGGQADDWKMYFYVSPYERTRSTLREIGRSFSKRRIIGVREECRVREQDFGNFQVEERMLVIKESRERFGRFFFRFPEGESAADVFDRVASNNSVSSSLLLFLLHYFTQKNKHESDDRVLHAVQFSVIYLNYTLIKHAYKVIFFTIHIND